MNNKNVAIGTVIILVSVITFIAFFTETYTTLLSINPAAAMVAITVAVIGIVWFKKTAKS